MTEIKSSYMIDFKPIRIEDKELITTYFFACRNRDCNLSFVNLYTWQFLTNSHYAVVDGCLVVRFTLDEESVELAELKGKNFQPKRNHVNKFKRTYNYKYTPLTVDLIPHCLELEEKWCEEHDCEEEESLINERKALNIALRNFDALGLVGGALWVDDEIVGFTYGAPVNHDTFAVHIEKADSHIDGSYNILNQEFARHIPEQYVYLNREEDLGIPGLRKAKLSYRPVILLEKGYAELIESLK